MNPDLRDVAFTAETFAPLLEEAGADGTFLLRLRDEWLSGDMRFERAGEFLFGAYVDGALVGVGGLSQDPYHPADRLGRVRHVYVRRAFRRRGIARALTAAIVERARAHCSVLRLRTRNPGAAALYESLGFIRDERDGETHRLVL